MPHGQLQESQCNEENMGRGNRVGLSGDDSGCRERCRQDSGGQYHEYRRAEFLAALGAWLHEGKIKYREDVVRGLANAPKAFLGLLQGHNFGKVVVDVGGTET